MNLQNNTEKREHILVCLSSAPSNSKIIDTAAKMAEAFKGTFTALYIETLGFVNMNEVDKKRLKQNMKQAELLGAKIETVSGDDVPFQIAEFARLSGVTKIVIGRSAVVKKHLIRKPTLTEKLIAHAPNIDIHIIPDGINAADYKYPKATKKKQIKLSVRDLSISTAMLLLATALGYLFMELGFTEANTITVYILSVLLTSILTSHRVYSLVSSVISVIMFNFFFTEPHFTLKAYDGGYPATFAIMLTAAFISSTLAIKLKNHAKNSARLAYQTKILFDTNQILQRANGKKEILFATINQLTKLLSRKVFISSCENGVIDNSSMFCCDDGIEELSETEHNAIKWVFENNHHAGATTDRFPEAQYFYLAIRVNDNVYGIVGIKMDENPLDSFENSVLLSILGECAITLEIEKNAKEKEQAAILAKNEQLRANLLRAISHDLRTPLTSISGNADNLISNEGAFDDDTKKQIYSDIYNDSIWLINLVENILSVTRLEDGKMQLNKSAELIDEIIAEALEHTKKRSIEHSINVISTENMMLVNVDARLIVQVLVNIIDNAVKYTSKGTQITICTKKCGNILEVSVADNGQGIADEAKERIFDMFYSGAKTLADSRRSLGLGLALCKSIINAHGGEISVSDNEPVGTVFTFTLPVKEININEL